jgi:hypothetical protein
MTSGLDTNVYVSAEPIGYHINCETQGPLRNCGVRFFFHVLNERDSAIRVDYCSVQGGGIDSGPIFMEQAFEINNTPFVIEAHDAGGRVGQFGYDDPPSHVMSVSVWHASCQFVEV